VTSPNAQDSVGQYDPDSAAKHRAKQTVINLVLALVATLGIVLVTVLVVPRDDSNRIKPIDYLAAAVAAEESSKLNIAAPADLPEGWWANQAKWSETAADGVKVWKVGFVGPENQYVGVTQAFDVNPTWVALQLTGFEKYVYTYGGDEGWQFYQPGKNIDADPYLWVLEKDGMFISMRSTARTLELQEFAKLIESELTK
jgi:hypothetical protein